MNAIAGIAPIYAIAGFVIGMLVGMTGVGGGSLMTPVLILLFGIHPAVAVGTDLLHAAVTKTAGSLVHGFNGTIEWSIVRRLAAGSIPMTAITILAMSTVDINGTAGRELVNVVLTVALVVTVVVLIFRDRIVKRYADRFGVLTPKQTSVLTVIAGGILGTIVSISSVGAGAIGVTCLILLYPKLPTARIVGSDIAHAVPLTLLAGIGHWLLGSIDLQIFAYLIVGSVPGILLGSYMAIRIPERALRVVLAVVLVVVAAKLAIGLLPPGSNMVASRITPLMRRSGADRRHARRATPWRVR